MPDRPTRPSRVPVLLTSLWYAVLALVFVIMLTRTGGAIPQAGLFGLVGVAVTLPIALLMTLRLPAGGAPSSLDELVQATRALQRESGLSETAKRVLHRKEERDLLRGAIEHDIQSGDLDAALVLVEELAERFGYRDDAEKFRERIEQQRTESRERAATAAVDQLDALIDDRRWSDAFAEARRIARLFPEMHDATALRERVEQSRATYRHALERRFLQAADNDSIDEAMELLKELDQYLTPAEAGPLQEVARGVIGKSRENLAARFKLLVQDHEYAAAIEMGQRIMQEFPNTRMAQEAREVLPMLHQRVGGAVGS